MPKQRLTDRQLISGVTLTDLLHFVVTGDTTQNPAGSSYKGNVEQLFGAFSAYTCSNPLTVEVVNACNSGITINGDVVINGSATTINTEVIQSKDNNILLNYSGTHLTALGGGITVEDGQADGIDSSLTIDGDGCWNVDPGFCDLTVDGVAFTAQTPYLFVDDTSVSSITTRYTGNTITTSDYSNIGGGVTNEIGGEQHLSVISNGTENTITSGFSGNPPSLPLPNSAGTPVSFALGNVIGGGASNTIEGVVRDFPNGRDYSVGSTDSQFNTIGGGYRNYIFGKYNTISGGGRKQSSSSIIYEGGNSISGNSSTIGGGTGNIIKGRYSTIAGGGYYDFKSETSGNNIIGNLSFIGGGTKNTIDTSSWYSNGFGGGNSLSSIVGGGKNKISDGLFSYSIIGGGSANYVRAGKSFIGGGDSNIIGYGATPAAVPSDGYRSLIGGGYNNQVYSNLSIIVGGNSNQIFSQSEYSFIGGGLSHYMYKTNRSVIGGGSRNEMTSDFSFIGGGDRNSVFYANHGSIAGGRQNNIDYSVESFIGGGNQNNISVYSGLGFIGGGSSNTVTNYNYGSFIGGGDSNTIDNSYYSSIVGGRSNTINGSNNNSEYNAILGGRNNTIKTGSTDTFIIGSNITSISANTTHVERFNIRTADTGSTSTEVLVRESNGMVNSVELSTVTPQKYAASIPFTAATSQTVTHNLNDTDVIVQLKDSTGTLAIPNVVDNYTNNTVDIEVSSTETFRVIIIG